MAMDWPANPTEGQLFGIYIYSGGTWRVQGSTNNVGAQIAQLQAVDALNYHPNYVINGGFDIWQRGTSFNTFNTGTSVFGPDRFYAYRTSLSTGLTITRQASGLAGFQYCARVQRDSGNTATTNTNFLYDIETVNSLPMAGKTVTLSFYARAGANFSSTSNIMFTEFVMGLGTDQALRSGYTGGTSVSTNHVLTTSWQRFTVTATIPSNVTQIGLVFKNTPVGTAGANDYYEITGVQLEEGSVATPFRRAGGTIQGELAACQRYYLRYLLPVGASLGNGHCFFTTGAYISVNYPVEMRSAPAALDYSSVSYFQIYSAGGNKVAGNIGLASNTSSNKTALIGFAGTTGLTAGYGAWVESNNASAYIGFSAEL